MPDGSEGISPAHPCRNCGTPVTGPFCSGCGQEDKDFDHSFVRFLTNAASALFNLDSRTWRTIVPLLFRPGEFTARYLAGERVKFVPPVRLYLFVSLLYFLMVAWLPAGGPAVVWDVENPSLETEPRGVREDPVIEPGEGESRSIAERIRDELSEEGLEVPPFLERFVPGVDRAAQDPAAFRRAVLQGASYLMFILVPLFGLLVKLTYPGRRRYYLHYLLFAVHFHSFVFLLLSLRLLMEAPGWRFLSGLAGPLLLVVPVYLFVALRRVFGGSVSATGVRTLVVSVTYLGFLSAGLTSLVIFLLL